MFKMVFKLFFMSRRNDVASIVFKMFVFAGLAWLVVTPFADRVVGFSFEDYCNDEDHASLVDEVAQATQGAWQPENVTSSFDEDSDRWVVTFAEGGTPVTWRFSQSGDNLSTTLIDKLNAHAQERSGHTLVEIDTEDYFEGVMLPTDLASAVRALAA
jgi:hypothetical protein